MKRNIVWRMSISRRNWRKMDHGSETHKHRDIPNTILICWNPWKPHSRTVYSKPDLPDICDTSFKALIIPSHIDSF